MIKQFETFDALCEEILRDRADKSPSAGRYPVRLILLNSFQAMFDLAACLSRQNTEPFYLSTLLEDEDQWLTRDDIVNAVKERSTDSLILPLSEVLRFFPQNHFSTVLISICETENRADEYGKRIYIPLVGLKERVEKDFLRVYHRKDIWSPLWYLHTLPDKKTTVYQIGFPSDSLSLLPDIKNTRDWLSLWKKPPAAKIISVSGTMNFLYKDFLPDSVFSLERISNPKEYLEKIKGIAIAAPYTDTEKHWWDRLIREIGSREDKASDFSDCVHCQLNINNLKAMSGADLLTLWIQSSEQFDRWLLRYWFLAFGDKTAPYLHRIFSGVTAYSDEEIISRIWFEIFDMDCAGIQMAEERKTYLHVLHRECHLSFHQVEEKIRHRLENLTDDPVTVIKLYVSGISFEERKYIVRHFANADREMQQKYRKLLQNVYPELYHYLNWEEIQTEISDSQHWICEYFREYTLSKLINRKSERLEEILKEKNADENSFYQWYYAIASECEPEKNAFVIWMDGLGAEWFPFMEYLIGLHKDRFIEKKYIRKVNLPTVTDCNRFAHSLYIRDLDEYIHRENPYVHPDDLIKQMDMIKTLVQDKIMSTDHEQIIVTSDHGFTFLAQKQFGNQKKFDFSDADHEGRCMWTEKAYHSDTDFLVHTGDKGKKALVALHHTSLCQVPNREVHGGATPEEVLVPCLHISKIRESVSYTIKLVTKEISVKNPVMEIEIEPDPRAAPYLTISGKRMKYVKDENRWRVSLRGFKPGTYGFCVEILNQKSQHEILVKGGIQEKELF